MKQTAWMHFGDMPVLVRPARRRSAPLVVCYHGFGPPDNPVDMASAFPFRDVDLNCAYPSAPLFGSRLTPEERSATKERQRRDYLRQWLLPLIEQATEELLTIHRVLTEQFSADASRIGLLGFASGGLIVNAAIVAGALPITAGVLINAATSPVAAVTIAEHHLSLRYHWDQDARRQAARVDINDHLDVVAAREPPPAILALQGTRDDYVSQSDAESLQRELGARYAAAGHSDRIELQTLEAGHYLAPTSAPAAGLSSAAPYASMAANWFHTWLEATP